MTLTVHLIEDRAARFLEAAVVSGLNLLVASGTQAGNPANNQDAPR